MAIRLGYEELALVDLAVHGPAAAHDHHHNHHRQHQQQQHPPPPPSSSSSSSAGDRRGITVNDDDDDEDEEVMMKKKKQKQQQYEGPSPPPSPRNDRQMMLSILFDIVTMVVLGTLNLVLSKFLTIPMSNYPSSLTIHSVFWVLPPSLAYGIVQWKRGKLTPLSRHLVGRPSLTLVALSGTLALGWLLTFYGLEYTPGPLQVLLNQSVIPFSMAISYLCLGKTYQWQHYLGAITVLAGILIAIGDELTAERHVSMFELGWVGGYILSWAPFAALTVYMEWICESKPDLDPVLFNATLNILELPFLLPLALPFSAYLSQPHPMPPSLFFTNLYYGTLCLVGIDSQPGDQCWPWAPTLFIANTTVAVFVCIPFFNLSKNGGSNLVWLASALMMPLANITFSLPFLPQHQPFTAESIAALLVMTLGMLVYGYGDEAMAAIRRRLCRVNNNQGGKGGHLHRNSSSFNSAIEMLADSDRSGTIDEEEDDEGEEVVVINERV